MRSLESGEVSHGRPNEVTSSVRGASAPRPSRGRLRGWQARRFCSIPLPCLAMRNYKAREGRCCGSTGDVHRPLPAPAKLQCVHAYAEALPGLERFYLAVAPDGDVPAATMSGRHVVEIICSAQGPAVQRLARRAARRALTLPRGWTTIHAWRATWTPQQGF